MKFTLSWLKEHLDTEATLERSSTGLIGVGLEVEERRATRRGARALHRGACDRGATSIPMPTA